MRSRAVLVRQALERSHRARGVLGTIADVIGVVTFLAGAVTLVRGGALPQSVMALYLCLLTAILGVALFRVDLRLGRKSRQADAMPAFASSMVDLAAAEVDLVSGGTPVEYVRRLENACKSLAQSFSVATGHPCRVTVKTIGAPRILPSGGRDFAVHTLGRSADAPGGVPDSGTDYIGDNSDFRDLFSNNTEYFLCNDIPSALKSGYRDSHLSEEMIKSDRLPYRSTIVWPVRTLSTQGVWNVYGFVCVDAQVTETFDNFLDVPTGKAFAQALNSGLIRYLEQTRPRRATASKRAPAAKRSTRKQQ